MRNKLFYTSIALNIFLLIFCLLKFRSSQGKSNSSADVAQSRPVDYEISSNANFRTVYIKRNDSVYKRLWNEAFENQPEYAFLISCTYYYVTGNEIIKKDIELSKKQLEEIYHTQLLLNQSQFNKDGNQ